MTNENNNTNELVDRSDDDPTSEFEIPESLRNFGNDFAPEIEVDEPTFDIDELPPGTRHRTRVDMEAALAEQSQQIEALNFEMEQLLSRNRGLEAELEARKEIADDFSREAEESRNTISSAARSLETKDEEIKKAHAELENANSLAERMKDETSELQLAAKEYEGKIKALEDNLAASEKKFAALERESEKKQKAAQNRSAVAGGQSEEVKRLKKDLHSAHTQLEDLRGYVAGRKDAWATLNAELARLREQLEVRTRDADTISRELDERNSQLVRSREQYIIASEQLARQKAKVRKLSEKSRKLERALNHDARNEIASCRSRIAEQFGELVTLRQELSALRQDNARIEHYSDSLRRQLQEQLENSAESKGLLDRLEAGLTSANETIKTLSRQLDEERQRNNDHTDTTEKLRNEFEREIRRIRFELGAAEETIAGQEALNEQLVSNLMDHQGYRQALENQLSEVEKENEETIQKLTEELKRVRRDNEDFDRKLSIKDSAIADLIQELSNHTSNIELKGEFDNVLQKIDGFRPSMDEDSNQGNRERVARLLIGMSDGREVRFPLFKERLTIGRTSHNDIQLNIQYVSRRHAVISTDNGETRIIDWGSKNGVFVNRHQITEQVLRSGDIVSIGMADFKYEERPKR